jgi:NitT/TauT family transport system substrate-binding protein
MFFFFAEQRPQFGSDRTGLARSVGLSRRIGMMGVGSVVRSAWVGLLLCATLATCAAAAETPIKFTLDSKFVGPSAPILLPLDSGYYKAEGLNVSIDDATGSAEAIQRVASQTYDMGIADINALIRFHDADPKAPVKAVFIVYNRPAYAVIGRKSRGVIMPKSLEGKRLGAPTADLAYAQWPIFVKANGIDASKVTIENVGAPVREPMLAAGQVDAVTGLSYTNFVNLKDKGVPVDDIVVLLMADYGVDLYGDAIIVNEKFAAAHPDAVKGFLRAFVTGLKETVRAPASAVEPVLKRNDAARKDLAVERLKMAINDNIITPEVKANGIGGVDATRFAHAIDQTTLAYRFKSAKPKLEDIFDPAFLPSAADRKM